MFAPLRDLQLHFPSLEDFHYEPLELALLPESLPSVEPEVNGQVQTLEHNVWQLDLDARSKREEHRLKTWETFKDVTHVEPSPYLSEAGPRVFDAWLDLANAGPTSTVKADHFQRSMLSLGLGRDSAIFKYDASKKRFCARQDGLLPSGYSLGTIKSIVDSFMDGGSSFRALDAYIQDVYESLSANSTTIAFAQALSTVTRHLRAEILRNAGALQSLLQLQSLFAAPFVVIENVHGVLEKIKGVSEGREVVTILFDYSQSRDALSVSFRSILVQILARVSVPWLRSLESSIGLRFHGVNESLNLCDASAANDGTVRNGNPLQCPTGMIMEQDLPIVNETNQSRKILQTHLPDHILSRGNSHDTSQAPGLEWGFGWDDVERIQAKANLYESSLLEAMNTSSIGETPSKLLRSLKNAESMRLPFDIAITDIEEYMKESRAAFERPLPDPRCDDIDEPLATACRAAVSDFASTEPEFTPPLVVVPSLSFSPIIAAQARLVNLACLRLVFVEHKLQQHLSIQYRFHLLGDGVFASRFSHALFDPNLPPSQRRKGRTRGGTVGLNLGFRESWPPATSELRLALAGILKDCVRNSDEAGLIDRNGELPGNLSFSIRDLSDEQIDKCLDPYSVEALDFLRLLYKPSPPLDAIFAQSCMGKYDEIFKHLLRVARMMSVVNELYLERIRRSRSQDLKPCLITERFRVDAYCFVTIISTYFAQDGIVPIWSRFELCLKHIVSRISRNVQVGDISAHDSLHQVQQAHERVLDHIKFALLLRKRQEKAMQLLEEIFHSILLFAKASRNSRGVPTQAVEPLYKTFKTSVGAFIILCRELSTKKGLGAKSSQDGAPGTLFSQQSRELEEGNTLSRLLLKLEMNRYFSQFCKAESAPTQNI